MIPLLHNPSPGMMLHCLCAGHRGGRSVFLSSSNIQLASQLMLCGSSETCLLLSLRVLFFPLTISWSPPFLLFFFFFRVSHNGLCLPRHCKHSAHRPECWLWRHTSATVTAKTSCVREMLELLCPDSVTSLGKYKVKQRKCDP